METLIAVIIILWLLSPAGGSKWGRRQIAGPRPSPGESPCAGAGARLRRCFATFPPQGGGAFPERRARDRAPYLVGRSVIAPYLGRRNKMPPQGTNGTGGTSGTRRARGTRGMGGELRITGRRREWCRARSAATLRGLCRGRV